MGFWNQKTGNGWRGLFAVTMPEVAKLTPVLYACLWCWWPLLGKEGTPGARGSRTECPARVLDGSHAWLLKSPNDGSSDSGEGERAWALRSPMKEDTWPSNE